MKTSRNIAVLALAFATAFTACKKKTDPATQTGSVPVSITNTAGTQVLALNQNYQDANGDTFSISTFNYYISNIVFTDNTGKTFAEPNSYHLVEQAATGSGNFTITGVPASTYTSVTFMIGVDSLHDVSGAQTGALDQKNDMFWGWNTGYIMAKMEGETIGGRSFQFHIGGFSGQYSALRSVTLTFAQPLLVAVGGQRQVFMHADALSWFKAPHLIDLNTFASTMVPNTNSITIADNYANMFGIDSLK